MPGGIKADGYEKLVAKIMSTSLGFEDHGILTAMLQVEYGHMSQCVGGFAMSNVNVPPDELAVSTPRAADFIIGVLNACGVRRWEQLTGRTVFMIWKGEFRLNTMPDGIEPLPTERGVRFLFADWQASVTTAAIDASHGDSINAICSVCDKSLAWHKANRPRHLFKAKQ